MMKKILVAVSVLLLICAAVGSMAWYKLMKKAAIDETSWLYIEGQELSNPELLEGDAMRAALELVHFDQRLQEGRLNGAYKITKGMSAMQVARKLVNRQQDPVRLTFRSVRLKEELAGRLARPLMCDSAAVLDAMLDPDFLAEAGADAANIESVFLPDTYEVYWNIAPAELMKRMLREYRKFWNEARLAKAQALQLTPLEVSTLASIAEEETADRQERGVVARLYWNRLQRGMLLQADPTVKYAMGDFALRRILLSHLTVESPYNTYQHPGLPPGPIRVVEKATIDSLLNSQPHNYLYMCAKPDFSGRHNFATNGAEHQANAAAYHRALDARK